MTGPPVFLNIGQARALLAQFHETSGCRGWQLEAVGIMRCHVHVVVGVPGDPDPETLLRDLKSYGSRKLNEHDKRPVSGTWWTESGSRRKLPHDRAVAGAVAYVRDQENPLVVWLAPRWETELRLG
jgi:REP element-mobilizing transposase RayT